MLLPLFSLIAASICLISYVTLTILEQKYELGVLRALGATPKTILKIISIQTFTILLSSYAIGISLGIIVTLLILMPEPFITIFTIIQITGWLFAALALMFISSLYPAIKFATKNLREIMT